MLANSLPRGLDSPIQEVCQAQPLFSGEGSVFNVVRLTHLQVHDVLPVPVPLCDQLTPLGSEPLGLHGAEALESVLLLEWSLVEDGPIDSGTQLLGQLWMVAGLARPNALELVLVHVAMRVSAPHATASLQFLEEVLPECPAVQLGSQLGDLLQDHALLLRLLLLFCVALLAALGRLSFPLLLGQEIGDFL